MPNKNKKTTISQLYAEKLEKNLISIKKWALKNIKTIEKEYEPSDWDYLDVDRMESNEAYNRGCYRILEELLKQLKNKK